MIKLIFTGGRWYHAMKQDAVGTWSSKNGECFLYDGITEANSDSCIRDYVFPATHGIGQYTTECYCRAAASDPPPPPQVACGSVGDPHLTLP